MAFTFSYNPCMYYMKRDHRSVLILCFAAILWEEDVLWTDLRKEQHTAHYLCRHYGTKGLGCFFSLILI